MQAATLERARSEGWADEEVVQRVRAGDTALFEVLVRRYNQRLYRVARAIVRNDAEAEDVMQDAYVRAFAHLDQFEGRAQFAAWLTRIAVNEALARLRIQKRMQPLAEDGGVLGLTEENVKVRLHRGRAIMRENICDRVGTAPREAFPFLGARCDRMTALVMRRITASSNTAKS